jgi:hypothetical protein
MTSPGTLDEQTARRLFRTLADTRWSWTEADVDEVAARLGWTPVRRTERIVSTDTGLPLADPTARFQNDGAGGIDLVRLMVTPFAANDPAARAAVDDSFAALTTTATAVLGPPTRRLPGAFPAVRWRGPAATIVLTASPSAVELEWADNAYLDRMDEVNDAG